MSRKFSLALVLAIVLSSLSLSPAHAVADGTVACGRGGTFTVTNNVVTSNTNCAGYVDIPEGVVTIGNQAFLNNQTINNVTIPSTVTLINTDAFRNSSVLDVRFSGISQLTTIGAGAFRFAGYLSRITIPNSVQTIGANAFASSSALATVSFLGEAPTMATNVFLGVRSDATAIVLPAYENTYVVVDGKWNGLNISVPYTVNCGSGGTFTIANYVVTISTDCSGTVVIPEGVLSIQAEAFSQATNITTVTIPSTVTSIGQAAFISSGVQSVTFSGTSQLETIGVSAFVSTTNLTSISIPSSVVTINETAFAFSSALATVTFLGNAPTMEANVFYSVAEDATAIVSPAYASSFELADGKWNGLNVNVQGSVACGDGGTFTVSHGVVTSNTNCSGTVTIPEGVTSIGADAFQVTPNITNVTIPSTLTTIGQDAFIWSGIQSVSYSGTSHLSSIGMSAFSMTPLLTTMTIPSSVQTISEGAFGYSSALKTVRFLGSAPSMGLYVFDGTATNATAIVSPAYASSFVTTNGKWNGLNLTVQETIACGTSGTFTVTNSVVTSNDSCSGTVDIPEGVTSIAQEGFRLAENITDVTISSTVTTIEQGAFRWSGIQSLSFSGTSHLTVIGVSSFGFALRLRTVTIPASVQMINRSAFAFSDALTTVNFLGAAPNTGAGIFYSVPGATAVVLPQYANSFVLTEGTWNGLSVTVQEIVACGTSGTFTVTNYVVTSNASCSGTVTIPEGTLSIGQNAFHLANVTAVTIPSTVTTIGEDAFLASGVRSVSFNGTSQLTSIGISAFGLADQLETITIPASVQTISETAFAYASALATMNFLGSAPSVGDGAFYSVTNATAIVPSEYANAYVLVDGKWQGLNVSLRYTVNCSASGAFTIIENVVTSASSCDGAAVIPSGVTGISASAFQGNHLSSVTFPNTITNIGGRAFDGNNIRSVSIPASVTSIGGLAFNDNLLSSVIFIGNAPTAGGSIFARNETLAKVDVTYGTTGWDTTYSGIPVRINYTLSFDTRGGSAVAPQGFNEDTVISLPTSPTRDGFTFGGWMTSENGSVIRFPYTPTATSNLTLYARWLKRASVSTKPTITGKAISTKKGSNKLTVKKGTWSGSPAPTFTYQWYSCKVIVKAPTQTVPKTCKAVSKATKPTLAVTKTFKGKFLTVKVTGTSAGTASTMWLAKSTKKVK